MCNRQREGLVNNIEDTVRGHIIAKMPPESSGELVTMPLRQLLGTYWTWRERFPSSRPRTVHRSRELLASARAQRYASELAEVVRKMQAGEDLTPHLSERVQTAYISDQQRPTRHPKQRDADRDRMLSAWGVHHLHLSSAPGRGSFTARGRELLYVVFRPADVYLLGIYTHTDWARKELVEIIVTNWPDAGLFLKSNYVKGQTTQFTDDDRRQLRRANVNEALFEVNGAFYGPPGLGVTASGGSVAADWRAMRYMENLRQLREHLDDRLVAFGQELDEAAGRPVTGDWTPRVEDDRVGLQRGEDAFIGIPWLDVD